MSINKKDLIKHISQRVNYEPVEPAIIPEVINDEETEPDSLLTLQQEQEELLRIEGELRAIQEDFIVKSGERYKQIMETKLYKSVGYNNFKVYCSERLGISYRQVYRLIDAARVIQNLKRVTHGYVHHNVHNVYTARLLRCA